jgi:hypothetical protein
VSHDVDDPLLADVAREVVAGAAPEELPLYRAASEAYLEDPERALEQRSPRDETLGFGADVALTLLTPIALAVTTDVLRFLRAELTKQAKEEGSQAVGELVRRLFKKFRAPAEQKGEPVPPPLTEAQLDQVRALAYEKAIQLRLSEERADLLADAVAGGLAASPD